MLEQVKVFVNPPFTLPEGGRTIVQFVRASVRGVRVRPSLETSRRGGPAAFLHEEEETEFCMANSPVDYHAGNLLPSPLSPTQKRPARKVLWLSFLYFVQGRQNQRAPLCKLVSLWTMMSSDQPTSRTFYTYILYTQIQGCHMIS